MRKFSSLAHWQISVEGAKISLSILPTSVGVGRNFHFGAIGPSEFSPQVWGLVWQNRVKEKTFYSKSPHMWGRSYGRQVSVSSIIPLQTWVDDQESPPPIGVIRYRSISFIDASPLLLLYSNCLKPLWGLLYALLASSENQRNKEELVPQGAFLGIKRPKLCFSLKFSERMY